MDIFEALWRLNEDKTFHISNRDSMESFKYSAVYFTGVLFALFSIPSYEIHIKVCFTLLL